MLLSEIGERLGIDNRILRYVVERNLVPGISRVNKGRGRQRKLTTSQARMAVLAALLHQNGIRGDALAETMRMAKRIIKGEIQPGRVVIETSAFSVRITINVSELLRQIP